MKRLEDVSMAEKNFTLVLVGMMGSGKSSVGIRLARALEMPFFDSDDEIEKAAGMPAGELFSLHGEESFREGEQRIIARLLNGPPHVLATGGGAVTNAQTRQLIKDRTISIWLKADFDVLLERATKRPTRPLLDVSDPAAVITRLMGEREEFYGQADIHIENQSGPHQNTVDHILKQLDALLHNANAHRAQPIDQ